jgi:hypothetical protein
MLAQPTICQRIQQLIRPVSAVVGIKQMIGHTNQTVEGDPFQQKWAFVLYARHSRYAHLASALSIGAIARRLTSRVTCGMPQPLFQLVNIMPFHTNHVNAHDRSGP